MSGGGLFFDLCDFDLGLRFDRMHDDNVFDRGRLLAVVSLFADCCDVVGLYNGVTVRGMVLRR